jgi:hypothetical protein
MRDTVRLGLAMAVLMGLPSVSFADDWTATRLFGPVLQLVGGQWQPVARGDLVPDGRVIRTVGMGRATFMRGNETVDVGTNTQIQIFDKGTGKPFTTVKQYFGTVSVEAEVQQVQHFAVQTPYLAAVVKGTRFTVTSGETGASVSVRRGHVAVEDQHDHTHVLLSVGQSASVDTVKTDGAIAVSGDGDLPAIVPGHVRLTSSASSSGGSTSGDDKGKSDKADKADKSDKAEKADKSEKAVKSETGSSGSGNSGSGSGNSGSGNSGSGSDNSGSGKGKDKDKKDD